MTSSDWVDSDEEWVAVVGPFEVAMEYEDLVAYVSWEEAGRPDPGDYPMYAKASGMINKAADEDKADDAEHLADHDAIASQLASGDGKPARERGRRSLVARHMLAQHLQRFHDQRMGDANRRSLETRHTKLHEGVDP